MTPTNKIRRPQNSPLSEFEIEKKRSKYVRILNSFISKKKQVFFMNKDVFNFIVIYLIKYLKTSIFSIWSRIIQHKRCLNRAAIKNS